MFFALGEMLEVYVSFFVYFYKFYTCFCYSLQTYAKRPVYKCRQTRLLFIRVLYCVFGLYAINVSFKGTENVPIPVSIFSL